MDQVELGELIHELTHRIVALADLAESVQVGAFPAYEAGRWLMAVAALSETTRDRALELFTLSHGLRSESEARAGLPGPELIARVQAALACDCGGGAR